MTTKRKAKLRVDSAIRWDPRLLPNAAVRQIAEALTFPNWNRIEAKAQKLRGWERMPATVSMFDQAVLPRGFALQMKRILEANSIEVDWEDDRASVPVWTGGWKKVKLRDYQEPACQRILDVQQGIWEAPPASGKTVTVLESIRRAGERAIVIVNTANIARQWVERSEEFLGVTPSVVGDGDFAVADITIALQQTLWSRRDELDEAGFWAMFGFICLDECHHLPAHTFRDTVQRFPAQWRIGVSGTPEMKMGRLPEMEAILGHRFHVTDKATLVAAGVIAKPRVEVVTSSFVYDYHPTHEHRGIAGSACLEPGCSRNRHARRHNNNYTEMMTALTLDVDRNRMVAAKVVESLKQGRTVLVVSKRLKHLELLQRAAIDAGAKREQCFRFSGAEDSATRMAIADRAMKGGVALFSTIGDEALDIPRLDTVILAWPSRNVRLVQQRIGRVERVHAAKFEPLVVDVYDAEVGVLRSQFHERNREVYAKQQLEVRGLLKQAA